MLMVGVILLSVATIVGTLLIIVEVIDKHFTLVLYLLGSRLFLVWDVLW